MAKQSKRFREAQALIEDGKFYTADEAVELVKKTATAKFDETIELHVRLGVDPKYADQQVRGKAKEFWHSSRARKSLKLKRRARITSAPMIWLRRFKAAGSISTWQSRLPT